ncbi:hypothetical protein [Virgibacillus sp.]|uniref:hypothetical protein n=1 Tax=Virgibacillus sp. TaxID=1872700 RepID=UPI0017B17C9C|nr:hypothetical protein [Virgibacillus sp.]NWO15167.1 hypothetical protein [Virgibacillus sp.]
MQTRFNQTILNKQFMSHPTLSKIIHKSNIGARSPYDGITLYSNDIVSREFWDLVSPAKYINYSLNAKDNGYYRYLLHHQLFVIKWGSRYRQQSNTVIKINPHKNLMTPIELLDMVSLILGDYENAMVGTWDEQIDITEYNSHEVAKRLWVSYLREDPYNPPQSNSTYYYNQRYGSQTKVYNKAKELGIHQQLTRIEKKHKVQKKHRTTLVDFLLDERVDVLKNVRMVDIDLLDGRKKVKRLINAEKTLMHAYRDLSSAEKKQFKRHQAYINPCIDIHSILRSNIEKWMLTSRLLRLKIIVDQVSDTWKHTERVALIPQMVNPISVKKNIQLIGWTINKREALYQSAMSVPYEFT